MLVCEHCRTNDCLELTGGEIDVDDGELQFVVLHFECQNHGLEGTYRNSGDAETVDDSLVQVDDRKIRADGGTRGDD